jgi:hypothetical protein
MSINQIALFAQGGLPSVDMNSFKQSIKAAATALKQSTTNMPYLRMGKDGMWAYGADMVEVEKGSLWAINPFSMEMGFIAWGEKNTKDDGVIMGHKMALIADGEAAAVQRGSLPEVGAPWTPCVAFNAMRITGEDEGTMVKYEANSLSGREAFASVLGLVSKAVVSNDDKVVPIITLESTHYIHKKHGKIYTPIFNVKRMVMPGDKELGGGGGEASPARAEAAKTEPVREEAQPAPQQEGAVRRRRR